jgi:hypothetical protein
VEGVVARAGAKALVAPEALGLDLTRSAEDHLTISRLDANDVLGRRRERFHGGVARGR